MLHTPNNPISLALTLSTLSHDQRSAGRVATAVQDHSARPGSAPSGATSEEPAVCAGEQSTVAGSQQAPGAAARTKPVTFLGSMLFRRGVSGTRVVARGKTQTVAGHKFEGFGTHCDAYPCDYLTVAAAIGTTDSDIDEFIVRLNACMQEFRKV